MKRCIRLNEADNVATLLSPAQDKDVFTITDSSGEEVGSITVCGTVPFAHKVALKKIEQGAHVVKLGSVIGVATAAIDAGEHAHVHNIASIEGMRGVKK
jgi:altronate dehydratase small subunit